MDAVFVEISSVEIEFVLLSPNTFLKQVLFKTSYFLLMIFVIFNESESYIIVQRTPLINKRR